MEEMISASSAAKLLGLKPRYFSETFIHMHRDFPRAYRYSENGHRFFKKAEVMQWLETRKEAA